MSLLNTRELPQEIIDFIIEGLHGDAGSASDYSEGTRDALIACTQVSKCLRAPARRMLFSTLRITSTLNKNSGSVLEMVKALLALFQESDTHPSDLFSIIQKVHIDINMMADESGLIKVLNLLCDNAFNLYGICLSGYQHQPIVWGDKGLRTRRTIMKLCSTDGVDTLSFKDVDGLPVEIITKCAPLKSLELVRVTFATSKAKPSKSKAARSAVWAPSSLENISIRGFIDEFGRVCSAVRADLSNIKNIRAFIANGSDSGTVRDLTQMAAKSLKVLDLEYPRLDLEFMYRPHIDLGILTSLCTLRLRIDASSRQSLPTATDVLRIIKRTTKPSNINVLELFYYSMDMVQSRTLDPKTSPTWPALHPDRLRENLPRLSELYVRLDIRIRNADWRQKTPQDLHSLGKEVEKEVEALICAPSEGISRPLLGSAVRVDLIYAQEATEA
ncbi:hypothetical protein GALMADRAFT_1217629 [Galerina marginata CBS 339.88]|uniref:F-box domain-containing protein n=1 Tax=Galerina marginata (strain CBS 339.88) TaxID=685588 RepID=A0A067S4U1_GALM3|nr:hypothetical protein GALMADRAFT_1217629 [Galerina marginata CBS 339.88]